MTKAADLLTIKYTLVVTNVPYLGRKSHTDPLLAYADSYHPDARSDLATIFVSRLCRILQTGGTLGLVTPQNWLFLKTYAALRRRLLKDFRWHMLAKLGPAAFQDMNWWAANTMLLLIGADSVADGGFLTGVDASDTRDALKKGNLLRENVLYTPNQAAQLLNPDARVTFEQLYDADTELLEDYADCLQGISATDQSLFIHKFWEHPQIPSDWSLLLGSFPETCFYSGREQLLWLSRLVQVAQSYGAAIRGRASWGQPGVLVRQMRHLPATLSTGEPFDANVACIVPRNQEDMSAVWAFCSSQEFHSTVRRIDQKTQVTNATLGKVPFEVNHWRKVGAKRHPAGFPEPESDSPTQWIFHGHPYEAEEGVIMQVAVARLLGYRWPAELDPDMRLSDRARELCEECERLVPLSDKDGIVCIPSIRGEDPASDRLLALLTECDIEPEIDLDEWLRNEFFQEHCELFHHRPFIWHIWDGRKRDGFHALINYHKLAESDGKGRRLLENLTYAYLGDWINRCKDEVKRGEGGAEDRLVAALALQERLIAILKGETPFDLFVRWKPLAEQPIGWDPDINDGVRLNIRPFMASDIPGVRKGAGILKYKPNIKWGKDRGKELVRPKEEYPWFWGWDGETEDFLGGEDPDGNRWNDCHYSNAVKAKARAAGAP